MSDEELQTNRVENSRAVCPLCGMEEQLPWWETFEMNPVIREKIRESRKPQVRVFYPSFMAAAEAWGPHITEGLDSDV